MDMFGHARSLLQRPSSLSWEELCVLIAGRERNDPLAVYVTQAARRWPVRLRAWPRDWWKAWCAEGRAPRWSALPRALDLSAEGVGLASALRPCHLLELPGRANLVWLRLADHALVSFDTDAARVLLGAFPALCALSLSGCGLRGEQITTLLTNAPESLRALDLSENPLTVDALAALLRAPCVRHLERMDLSWIAMGDAGLATLTPVLQHLPALRQLTLVCCGVSGEGAERLRAATGVEVVLRAPRRAGDRLDVPDGVFASQGAESRHVYLYTSSAGTRRFVFDSTFSRGDLLVREQVRGRAVAGPEGHLLGWRELALGVERDAEGSLIEIAAPAQVWFRKPLRVLGSSQDAAGLVTLQTSAGVFDQLERAPSAVFDAVATMNEAVGWTLSI